MDIIELIKYENENTALDFKAIQYKKEMYESFLKDIMAMANALVDGNRYIVIGVKHLPNGDKEYKSIPSGDFVDEATYQQLIKSNIEPDIELKYEALNMEGNLLGVFTISSCENQPYMMGKKYKSLNEGDSYIRRGSQQCRLKRSNLDKMIYERRRKESISVYLPYQRTLQLEFEGINGILISAKKSLENLIPLFDSSWKPIEAMVSNIQLSTWDAIIKSDIFPFIPEKSSQALYETVNSVYNVVRTIKTIGAKMVFFKEWMEYDKKTENPQPINSIKLYLITNAIPEAKQAIDIALENITNSIIIIKKNLI
ncbi:MAG: ATP-binding protein [Ignavibacteriaceae bacterium]|nr:ATP-binding protein [Ignavibacteriaceae bacterium]